MKNVNNYTVTFFNFKRIRECTSNNQLKIEAMKELLKELQAQARELIDLGDSHEKCEGYGMMKVLDSIGCIPVFNSEPIYFVIVSQGYNKDLQREEIQINCGENGILMIVKTDEGFVVDIFDIGGDCINTMTVWEDSINPLFDDNDDEPIDPNNFSLAEQEDFLDVWGQFTDEVCADLGYDWETSNDLLMVDYFYYEPMKYWIPKTSILYTPREQSIAHYLRLG